MGKEVDKFKKCLKMIVFSHLTFVLTWRAKQWSKVKAQTKVYTFVILIKMSQWYCYRIGEESPHKSKDES